MGAITVVQEDAADKAALAELPSDAEIKDDVLLQAAMDCGLNNKQKIFVEEWIKTGNATKSAIAAGYNNGNYAACTVEGARLLASAKIKKYVDLINRYAVMRAGITPERILREQSKMAFWQVKDLLEDDGTPKKVSDINDDTAAAVLGIEVRTVRCPDGEYATVTKYNMADKRAALNDLAKAIGMVTDKVAVGGSDDMPAIKMQDVTDRDAIKALLFKMTLHKREQAKNGMIDVT